MERLKFLSHSGDRLYKFEGFGRFGKEVRGRARLVGEAEFGPLPVSAEAGFSIYPVVKGESLAAEGLSSDTIAGIARYCAFRKNEFRCEAPPVKEMETMLRFNFAEEFGNPCDLQALEIEHPVIADGRMLPHKWLRSEKGRLLKVDNASHGDDHFFPGPTDIAWDLAGAIVEWNMNDAVLEEFLNCYRRESGDDPGNRLAAYLLAYSVFRMGYFKMATEAMRGSSEEARLTAGYLYYRQIAAQVNERAVAQGEVLKLVPKQSQSLASKLAIKQLA